MYTEFRYTLRRLRGQMLGWSIGLALYVLLMAAFYSDLAGMDIKPFLESYPEEMLGFFGDAIWNIGTPPGYLETYFFNYMPVIIGIFAVGTGANLLVGDEEKGTLDLVMSYPVSRTAVLWGRLLGFLAATAVILLVAWLSWVIPAEASGMDLTWIEFLRPFGPLFAELALFGMLALLLSMVLPSARMAGMVTGALLVADYLLMGLSNINEDLKAVVKFTPLYYYQGGKAVSGLNWEWLAGLLAAAAVVALLAWWRFEKRDIRVGGEGGWQWPRLPFRIGSRAGREA